MTTAHIHVHNGDLPAACTCSRARSPSTPRPSGSSRDGTGYASCSCPAATASASGPVRRQELGRSPEPQGVADRSQGSEDLPLRALRCGRSGGLPRRHDGAGVLHQDRFEAGAHLYGPTWAQGSRGRTDRARDVEAAAVVGLGVPRRCRTPSAPTPPRTSSIFTRSKPSWTTCWRAKAAPSSAESAFRFLSARARLDWAGSRKWTFLDTDDDC